jgi:hypothetical protein
MIKTFQWSETNGEQEGMRLTKWRMWRNKFNSIMQKKESKRHVCAGSSFILKHTEHVLTFSEAKQKVKQMENKKEWDLLKGEGTSSIRPCGKKNLRGMFAQGQVLYWNTQNTEHVVAAAAIQGRNVSLSSISITVTWRSNIVLFHVISMNIVSEKIKRNKHLLIFSMWFTIEEKPRLNDMTGLSGWGMKGYEIRS